MFLQPQIYLLSFGEAEGKILLYVAIVSATLFSTVLQHFSMNARISSPLFSLEAVCEEMLAKSPSSLTL